MKKILGLLFVTAILFSSCEEWIDPEINVDPDNPKDVSIGVLLPAIQGAFAYYYGGIDIVGIQSVWMQQLTGSDRQFVAINNYTIRRSDPNNLWNSLYQGVMMDCKQLVEKAEEDGEDNMAGVGKIYMAMALATATDVWGDIPYTEAFLGSENLTPGFEPQEAIYGYVMDLINGAIEDLESTNNIAGITNDYIYGGDPSKWLAAAYTLRARYEMRLTERKSVDFQSVLDDLEMGIASTDDDFDQPFDGSSSAGYNPLYQFIEQRGGYIINNATYDDMMAGDPRNGIQEWSANGFWSSQGSPVHFTGYAERLFIAAEALYRDGSEGLAQDTLVAAVGASMEKYEVDLFSADAIAFMEAFETEVDALSGEDLLEKIIVEKYKHMFAHPEPYNDFRRTGYPELTPVAGSEVPVRYPYAQDSYDYNPNNTPDANIFQPVWWDNN
jgi:hypothetical protein